MLTFILQTAGPCLFIALQISCVMVALEIMKMRAVKKLSSVPFVSLLACGVYWSLYGWLKKDMTIFIPNAVSIIAGAFCMWIYYTYALLKPNALYTALVIFLIFGGFLGAMDMTSAIGTIGCVMSVLMSGSPLAVVRTVIKEQSTASLPFSTSFVAWLNSCSWVAYGYFVANDPMIIMPNSLGLVLTSSQMFLFVLYGITTATQVGGGVALSSGPAPDFKSHEDENPYNV